MSAPTLDRPVAEADVIASTTPRRLWRAVMAVGVASTAVGVGLLVAGLVGGPGLVRPSFEDGVAVELPWGDEAAQGAPGSWVVNYEDGTSTTMSIPWDGTAVASARLADGPVDLATVTGVSVVGDELVTTIAFDGCDYYHEREMQILPTLTVELASGRERVVRFDHPLFVRSPMLWQCPDRLVDRAAKQRDEL